MSQTVDGPRARYREQVKSEVLVHAWEQVAAAGASALSLKAIAQRMGMTAPALYRYVASRDDLLTELVLSAYADLAGTVEAAAEAGAEVEPGQRLRLVAGALRAWAVADPQRYLLLYGTPVPGYAAPPEATELAQRIFAPLHAAFVAALPQSGTRARRAKLAHDLTVTLWTRLHGALSLELAGHFAGMDVDPGRHFASELESVVPGPASGRRR